MHPYLKKNHSSLRSNPRLRNTSNVGARSELFVSCDLLARGWDVFRAVSPGAKCDLIAFDGKRLLRIEVKTGSMRNGRLICARPKRKFSDVLAVVVRDKITYLPDI